MISRFACIAAILFCSVGYGQAVPGVLNGGTQFATPATNGVQGQNLSLNTVVSANGGLLQFTDPESDGILLRRMSRESADHNTYKRPPMAASPPWQPSTAYFQSNVVAHGGNLFVCFANGTSSTTGPTSLIPDGALDGSTGWIYVGPNTVTVDPGQSLTTWSTGLTVTAGQLLSVQSARIYAVTTGGTTNVSGTGPTGTGIGITDGTAVLSYYGALKTVPLIEDWPTFTSQTSTPSGLTNTFAFSSGTWQNVGAISAKPVAGGSGYVVGDVITLSGGTSSVTTQLTVSSVSGGAVTGVTVSRAGSYTGLPQTPVSQGSTTGSGTSATFAVQWPDPYFLKCRGGYCGGIGSGNQLVVYTYTAADNTAPIEQHSSLEFFSDAPKISFICSTTAAFFNVIIDGRQWNLGGLPNSTSTAYNQTFDFSTTGGRRPRHYRLEARAASRLSGIRVDPQSSVWQPSDVDKITAVVISDSIWAGAAYGPHLPGNAINQRIGHELGWNDFWDFSYGGTGYLTDGASSRYRYRLAEAVAKNPKVIVFMGSTNDGGQSASAVGAECTYCLTQLRSLGYRGLIIVAGIISIDDSNNSTWPVGKKLSDYETALASAVSGMSDAKISWVPIRLDSTLPWLTGAWNNSINTTCLNFTIYINNTDKIHPCDVGHTYLSRRLSTAFRQILWSQK